jgi:hypothetical protein
MAMTRPPADIAPGTFFEQWLPAEYARLGSGATPPDSAVVVHLDGDGGGAWTLRVQGGALTGKPGAADAADLVLRQTVADWRAAVCGEDGAPDILPDNVNPMRALAGAGSPAAQQMLQSLSGTLVFQVSGFAGRTWAIRVSFKGAASPEATIALDADTMQQMRSGALPPPQAYFAGKIQITGDVNFAMQLGMAMMARGGAR